MSEAVLNNVTYTYPLSKTPALRNITYNFEAGTLYGIVGANGSGKSTLCNLVKGLIPSFYQGKLTGMVEIKGKKLDDWDPDILASQIGYIFQNPFTQISGIKDSVFEEVALGLENLGISKDKMIDRVIEVANLLDIEDLLEKNPNNLSGGQRQRVAFASTIAMDNDFLIIDEPTSQLDPEGTEGVFAIIDTLKRLGKTILLVEHKIDLLAEYADQILVLHGGEILMSGPVATILSDFNLLDIDVALPQTVLLAKEFAKVGYPLNGIPITLRQAEEILSRAGDELVCMQSN